MGLKFVIDTLEGLAPVLREHYTATKDGKYQLALDGEHPDTLKVAEFRENNIKLTKDLVRFDGIDPVAVAADRSALAELQKAKPDARIAELEAALATEKTARTAAQALADVSVLKSTIADKFLKAGGRASATEFMVAKAKELFTVENGVLVGKVFDPTRPGEKLTVDGFITMQVKESDFAFLPSSGGGATTSRSSGSTGVKELRNPTANELGAHAAAISRGELKVVYDN